MIEIAAVVLLCIANRKRAIARGKSGGAAIAYTIVLWIGFEFIGALIAILIFGDSLIVYVFAIAFAAIGGVISWAISKSKGRSIIPGIPTYHAVSPACTVHIYRDDSHIERDEMYYFSLNDEDLGYLENDSMLTTYTSRTRNLITFHIDDETKERDAYLFGATSDGTVEIHVADGAFVKEQAPEPLQSANQDTQNAQSVTCAECGFQQGENHAYCVNCGRKL